MMESEFPCHWMEAYHNIDWENIKILDREDLRISRLVQEAIQIRKQSPALIHDEGLKIPLLNNVLINQKIFFKPNSSSLFCITTN